MAWRRGETAYALVIAWALFGIYSSQSRQYPAIGYTALAGMTVLLLSIAGKWFSASRSVSG
jgi:hypothetical protein